MGIENQRMVYAIPQGYMTADERFVLLVLAEQTNDEKMGWAHQQEHFSALLGQSERWLRRRIVALERAGWIRRLPQRTDKKTKRWLPRIIYLGGLKHGYWNGWHTQGLQPTTRAASRLEAEAKRRGLKYDPTWWTSEHTPSEPITVSATQLNKWRS